MTFADLKAGDSVFLDANTLVYHFTADAAFGTACTQLLQRIENQDLFGFTSTGVLGEAAHRLMTTEASSRFGWSFAGIGNRLRANPAEVKIEQCLLLGPRAARDTDAQERFRPGQRGKRWPRIRPGALESSLNNRCSLGKGNCVCFVLSSCRTQKGALVTSAGCRLFLPDR